MGTSNLGSVTVQLRTQNYRHHAQAQTLTCLCCWGTRCPLELRGVTSRRYPVTSLVAWVHVSLRELWASSLTCRSLGPTTRSSAVIDTERNTDDSSRSWWINCLQDKSVFVRKLEGRVCELFYFWRSSLKFSSLKNRKVFMMSFGVLLCAHSLTRLGDFHRTWRLSGSKTHSAGQFGKDGFKERVVRAEQQVLLMWLRHNPPQLWLIGSPNTWIQGSVFNKKGTHSALI